MNDSLGYLIEANNGDLMKTRAELLSIKFTSGNDGSLEDNQGHDQPSLYQR